MLLQFKNLIKILPIIRLELYNNKENNLLIPTQFLIEIVTLIKNHYKYQFKILISISGVDHPNNFFRFQVIYELLSLKFNSRIKLKILIDELTPIKSIETIFLSAV